MMRRLIFAIPLAMVLAACATSPTGRTQLMLVPPDLAINESRMAYEQTLGELTDSGQMLYDPALAERVERITGRLVAAAVQTWPHTAGWQWSVVLIDDPETVNAWCMAGGRMAIYSGLISKLDPSDDELAHVMGHEIAHAVANHSAEQMSLAILQVLAVLAIEIETEDH
ncbi:MAG: M48 family metalloprotease, partial [Gammaproteobacteria bacterium]|nr:M48 family metalloprotease [Gammaproteobacteria bacterium]